MIELNTKYVFHIPLYKYVENKLIPIEINPVLDDLITQLAESGFENLYITQTKGYYKSRSYDELLLTLFTHDNQLPESIFKNWFKMNNHLLMQEEFAFEHNNHLFIEKLSE